MFSFPQGNPGALAPCTTNVWWDVACVNGLQNFGRGKSLRFAMLGANHERSEPQR